MWEEGARIYGTPGVYNNFPISDGVEERYIWNDRITDLSTVLANEDLFAISNINSVDDQEHYIY